MPRTLVECVPNFSEGRDAAKVSEIVAAICSVPGVFVLDHEMDQDHNRSVVTFAGPSEVVGDAAIRGAGRAVELIDMNRHEGVHPRIGAADVVPFVPVEGVSMTDCVHIAHRVARQLWRRYHLPSYLYGEAALRPDRVRMASVRRGGYEGLRDEVRVNPERTPDFGKPQLHPTAGAVAVGARKFLIAYNINLASSDIEIARRIATLVRASSGGLPCVQAMGVMLESRNQAQVSMNLTDFDRTPMHVVYEAVRREAALYGVEIAEMEIVGLIPLRALDGAPQWFLDLTRIPPSLILENRLAEAVRALK